MTSKESPTACLPMMCVLRASISTRRLWSVKTVSGGEEWVMGMGDNPTSPVGYVGKTKKPGRTAGRNTREKWIIASRTVVSGTTAISADEEYLCTDTSVQYYRVHAASQEQMLYCAHARPPEASPRPLR